MTSGCHGGAGLGRGAYQIWKQYDPHFDAAATLTNGRSRAMGRQLGIENPSESSSCTVCHSPLRQTTSSSPTIIPTVHPADAGVSCVSCHGPSEPWLLSHTRPDYPKDALARLGMRQLSSAYQRANNCVACHQNLSNELVTARHPPLVFELDGLLIAEPKHWREDSTFSHLQTWLVGQAVALREAAAQSQRTPSPQRTAEVEALRALLTASHTGWDDSPLDLVQAADAFAQRISNSPLDPENGSKTLEHLLTARSAFAPDAFSRVDPQFRTWAVGFYTERLALALDRLNQTLPNSDASQVLIDTLFDAAKPPESFDTATATTFVERLDQLKAASP